MWCCRITGFGTLLVLLARLTTPKPLPKWVQEQHEEEVELVHSLLTGETAEGPQTSWNISQTYEQEKPKVKLPQYMIDLYNQYAYDRTSRPKANIIRSINAEDILQWSSKENCTCSHTLLFNVTIPEHEEVTKAELKLKISLGDWGFGHLSLFDVIDPKPSENLEGSNFFLASKDVVGDESLTFDVTETVKRWMQLKTEKHKLEIPLRAKIAQDICTKSGMVSMSFDGDQPPILIIFSDDQSREKTKLKIKLKQMILHEPESSFGMFVKNISYGLAEDSGISERKLRVKRSTENDYCKKVSLMVNLRDIGWDKFVIHPQRFDAGQCVGNCDYPLLESTSPTKHAIIQSALHHSRVKGVGNVCCVPIKLEALPIIYQEQASRVIKKEENMKVAQCGCR